MLTLLLFLQTARPELFFPHGEKAVVLIFIRSDCPISNRYAPDLQRLYERHGPRGVDFRLVYPEPGLTAAAMEKHGREYGYIIPALLDPGHEYVKRARARITPEAAVFVQGELVHHGRIDDGYVETGKERPRAMHHDLEEVLAAISGGKMIQPHEIPAVGCAIENLK